ncbi:MAG: phosphatase PAP2 family protein [Succinivibrionaceae bacterium]|nr:phosphatase PAP2 family protein [Succinivibrionaceae bacterium]
MNHNLKLKSLLGAAVVALLLQGCATGDNQAKSDSKGKPIPYYSVKDAPSAMEYMPAPPSKDSKNINEAADYRADLAWHKWGKQMRKDKALADAAIVHGGVSPEDIAGVFSKPFGIEINEQNTPNTFRLVKRTIATVRPLLQQVKDGYKRLRPYVALKEKTLMPAFEADQATEGSYPSGHTIRGWAVALVLSAVNPEAGEELLKMGFAYGDSRVISGYHWHSDTEASKYIASVGVAMLATSDEYIADLKAARAEVAKILADRAKAGK